MQRRRMTQEQMALAEMEARKRMRGASVAGERLQELLANAQQHIPHPGEQGGVMHTNPGGLEQVGHADTFTGPRPLMPPVSGARPQIGSGPYDGQGPREPVGPPQIDQHMKQQIEDFLDARRSFIQPERQPVSGAAGGVEAPSPLAQPKPGPQLPMPGNRTPAQMRADNPAMVERVKRRMRSGGMLARA